MIIKKIYRGLVPVRKIYIGEKLVWSSSEELILLLGEDLDSYDILAEVDGIDYAVLNAETPVLADDGSYYIITVSE